MPAASSEPHAVVLTDAEHEERPDCLVVIVPPGKGAWDWDDDWPTDEFWLRSVARLVARAAGAGPEPVGAVVCDGHMGLLLPGNVAGSDALARARRLLCAGLQHRFVVVVGKESGRPLLCRPVPWDAAGDRELAAAATYLSAANEQKTKALQDRR